MSDVTTEPADKIDRAPPIAFFLSAGSSLQTAILTHEAIETKPLTLRFELIIYYLFSHAIELTLKAFLRARGISALKLGRRPWRIFLSLLLVSQNSLCVRHHVINKLAIQPTALRLNQGCWRPTDRVLRLSVYLRVYDKAILLDMVVSRTETSHDPNLRV